MSRRRYKFLVFFKIVCCIFIFHSCAKKEISYYDLVSIYDQKLSTPEMGEWRFERNEKFQTFDDFNDTKKIKPTAEKKIIYLQPIGEFHNLELKEIQFLREYLQIYFQLETKILPEISTDIIPKNKRRIGNEGNEQFLAGYFLDSVLINNFPKDAVVVMGISQKDLFPKPDWNYVFGMASYENGVGITSAYRFHDGNLTNENFSKSLERLIKISSHEIGHMFGISHCLAANCVMNGTNSLYETDFHFARACSLCQRKLDSTLQFDEKKRLNELRNFFKKNALVREQKLVEADLKLLQ